MEDRKALQRNLERFDQWVIANCASQKGKEADPAPGPQQPYTMLQAWGRVARKLVGGKGLGGVG